MSATEADAAWSELRELRWTHQGGTLVKVATSPSAVPSLAAAAGSLDGTRVHVSAGGNVAFVSLASTFPPAALQERLRSLGLPAVTLCGNGPLWCGARATPAIAGAVKQALDPQNRFPSTED